MVPRAVHVDAWKLMNDKVKDIKFSVIIPSYNNPEEVFELLLSIQKQCPSIGEHEVIVVDDGSRDNKIEVSCSRFSFVTYIRCEKNSGVAAARNAGVESAKHDVLVFIDSDAVLESNFIPYLQRQFKNSEVVALTGTLVMIPVNPSPYRIYWGIYKDFHAPQTSYTTVFSGQVGAIRKEAFKKAGVWNSKIPGVACEEYEFTERLEKLGYRINYEPGLAIRPRYKGFIEMLPANFKRAKKWCVLFLSRRKFDDYASTFSGGMSYLLGCMACLSGTMAFFFSALRYVFILTLGLYILLTMRFWIYICRKRNIRFMLLCNFFHLVLSLVISFGAFCGFAYVFAGENARRRALDN